MRLSLSGAGLVDVRQTDALSFNGRDLQISQGLGFLGLVNVGPLAANFSHAQLFNPVGSIITVIVDRVTVISTAATPIRLTVHNTALTFSLTAGLNKNNGGAAPVGQLRSEQSLGFLGTEVARVIANAGGYKDFGLTFPVQLSAGQGIVVVPTVVLTSLDASWEWREV